VEAHNNYWNNEGDPNPFWKMIKLNLEEEIENNNWTLIYRRNNIWLCHEGEYENIDAIQANEKKQIWIVSSEQR
jgi:hypothetical protein